MWSQSGLFFSLSITVTEWPCWTVLFYEVVYVQQKNTRVSLTVPPCSWLAVAIFFSFLQITSLFSMSQSHWKVETERTLEANWFKVLMFKLRKWKLRDVTCLTNVTQPISVIVGTGIHDSWLWKCWIHRQPHPEVQREPTLLSLFLCSRPPSP